MQHRQCDTSYLPPRAGGPSNGIIFKVQYSIIRFEYLDMANNVQGEILMPSIVELLLNLNTCYDESFIKDNRGLL